MLALGTALGTALVVAFGSPPASAQYYRYYGYGYGYWHPARHRPTHQADKKAAKELAKEAKDPFGDIPKGPLQIFVSIDQQKLHLYSDGAHVADTSIATGVPSLPTPLGVFSVIQKQVFHRSNIYSNAPMPFMQRITWSGVAMHEGEGIGHRASHGCIRMPRDFAVRLYHLTRLGVPVFIANRELKPADFADPHLFVHRDKPLEPPPAAAPAVTDATPATPVANAAATSASPAALGLRVGTDNAAATSAAVADAAKPDPPVGDAPPPAVSLADPKVAADATAPIADPAATTSAPAPRSDAPQPAASLARLTMAANAAPSPAPQAAPSAAAVAPAAPAPTAALDPSVPMPPAEPPNLLKTAPPSKAPIAIFVSRKEKKIYVRQDFAPLFQAPVTITDPDKPFGTLVFTALDFAGGDRTTLRWNVVEFPAEPPKLKRKAEREVRYERYFRGRRRVEVIEKPADPSPPETPAGALSRIAIPQAAIDYISQLVIPASTLIISDHGLGEETGEGTNFIVVTR